MAPSRGASRNSPASLAPRPLAAVDSTGGRARQPAYRARGWSANRHRRRCNIFRPDSSPFSTGSVRRRSRCRRCRRRAQPARPTPATSTVSPVPRSSRRANSSALPAGRLNARPRAAGARQPWRRGGCAPAYRRRSARGRRRRDAASRSVATPPGRR